jgi:formylglycine-generating enzyme required for sulfatase activity/serine/threonine protein kinase
VLALLPPRRARFEKGQRAPGFADWELSELLGVGGFGEVWMATNPHLPPVALKFCLDPVAARSLRNEAALLGRVESQGKHPGIVRLLNTSLRSDPPCLMYEYVPGGDLSGLVRQWLATPGLDRVAASLAVMRQLADAVAFAHRLTPPIVHRDLKPANILLSAPSPPNPLSHRAHGESEIEPKAERGSRSALPSPPGGRGAGGEGVKIADFGIGDLVAAQAVGRLGTARIGRTIPTALRASCTPLYASPQQMRGEDPDPRDDVFALGVVWYQMLAGELADRPGADWREELAVVPDAVLDVLGRCLAVRAERRFSDGSALHAEIVRLGDARSRRPSELVPTEDEPDDFDFEEEDDPLDLAGKLQRSLASAQKTLARAVELCERQHDYASAVRLLEKLPEAFCDGALLDRVRSRRDRVAELRKTIRQSAKAMQFAGLRDRIEELLELQPEDSETRQLLDVVPWQPGPEVTNAVGMKLLLIPGGSFRMGSPGGEAGRSDDEGPPHAVVIGGNFYLGAFPVTQGQYQQVRGDNPSHFRRVAGLDPRTLPVENVSWDDAVAFCRALSELPEERKKGRVYRLPSEAEWEYCCRAGTESAFGVEAGRSLSSASANFDGRKPYGSGPRGDFLERTSPVGSYPPNAWGLYDVHGNVWEWCLDWYAAGYYKDSPKKDPTGPAKGTERVLRGGSWQNHARLCRSACRDRAGVAYRSLNAGFRVVMEVRRG